MSQSLLALAGTVNEAAIAYRDATNEHDAVICSDPRRALAAAGALLSAADALTGAIVERENEAPIEIPLDDLTRLAEVEELAAHQGVSIAEAVVLLVNEALSGTFLDGYRAAIEEHGIVETPPAEVGDGYAHDEPERDGATALPETRLVEIRGLAKASAGQFVDPAVVAECGRVLDRRGETWAASVLGRDVSRRSLAVPNRPALREGEEYALVFADSAEVALALEGLEP